VSQDFVLGVLDTAERIRTPLAEGFCRNVMEFWMVEFQSQGLHMVTDDEPDRVLQKAAATSAKWLIFATLGTYFEQDHPFLPALKEFLAERSDFFVMGHVLDRKQFWYELHDQCFVLNLEEYRRLGCPSYGGPRRGSFEMMKPSRSEENFHHDYTPKWVKASTEFAMYSGLENGHGLLAAGFKAGLDMIAFPESLRAGKYQFSPTVHGSFARKYWWWEDRQQEADRLFYAFNTESIPDVAPGYTLPPLKRLYTVASGLLFFEILRKFGFERSCIVNFYDKSSAALFIMRQLLESWDGRDYPQFLERVKPEGCHLFNFSNRQEKWRAFMDKFGGEAGWLEWFARVKDGCKFNWHRTNIFSEGMERALWYDPDPSGRGGSLFWLSNVFRFRYTAGARSLEERFEMQKTLLKWLSARNPDMFVYVCSAIGRNDPSAGLGIFKAKDYAADSHHVPRFWRRGPESYPKAVQHFFRQQVGKRGEIRTTPPEFRALRAGDLAKVPRDVIARFAAWIERESWVPSLRLDLDIPYREMWAEARACEKHFVKHRSELNPGWESVCLHGLSAQQTEDFYRYGVSSREAAQYRWTEIADRCPVAVNWLKTQWPMEHFDRVRFMLLRPGGYIQPHNDMDGVRGLSATNLALNQPESCEMVLQDYGVIPWRAGDVRRLDIGVNHSVYNGSDEDRYHMIIHGRIGHRFEQWNELIVRSYLKAVHGE
jgi:hypothetical protein